MPLSWALLLHSSKSTIVHVVSPTTQLRHFITISLHSTLSDEDDDNHQRQSQAAAGAAAGSDQQDQEQAGAETTTKPHECIRLLCSATAAFVPRETTGRNVRISCYGGHDSQPETEHSTIATSHSQTGSLDFSGRRRQQQQQQRRRRRQFSGGKNLAFPSITTHPTRENKNAP